MNFSKKIFIPFLVCTLASSFGYGMKKQRMRRRKRVNVPTTVVCELQVEANNLLKGIVPSKFFRKKDLQKIKTLAYNFNKKFTELGKEERAAVLNTIPWRGLKSAIEKDFCNIEDVVRELYENIRNLPEGEKPKEFFYTVSWEILKILEDASESWAGRKAGVECNKDRWGSQKKILAIGAGLLLIGLFGKWVGMCLGWTGMIVGYSGQQLFPGLFTVCLNWGLCLMAVAFLNSESVYGSEKRLLADGRKMKTREFFGELKQALLRLYASSKKRE